MTELALFAKMGGSRRTFLVSKVKPLNSSTLKVDAREELVKQRTYDTFNEMKVNQLEIRSVINSIFDKCQAYVS